MLVIQVSNVSLLFLSTPVKYTMYQRNNQCQYYVSKYKLMYVEQILTIIMVLNMFNILLRATKLNRVYLVRVRWAIVQ